MSETSSILTDELLIEFLQECKTKNLNPYNFPFVTEFQLKTFLYAKGLLTSQD